MTLTRTEGDSEKEALALTRRDFGKAASWLVPTVVTLSVTPSFAQSGSGNPNHPHRPQERPGEGQD